MRKLLAIILIATIACATEEEKTNPIEKVKEGVENIKDDVSDKAKEIADKAKEIAKDVADKAKKIADDISKKAQEMGEDISEKAKEISEDVSGKAKEIVKEFMKFFEKLSEEGQKAIVWLKDNGYWDEIVQLAETIGKAAAVQTCKTYVPDVGVSCDQIIQFVMDAIIALLNKIKDKSA